MNVINGTKSTFTAFSIKPRLILAWEFILVLIVPFAYYVRRAQSKPRLRFSRINGPIVMLLFYFVILLFVIFLFCYSVIFVILLFCYFVILFCHFIVLYFHYCYVILTYTSYKTQ